MIQTKKEPIHNSLGESSQFSVNLLAADLGCRSISGKMLSNDTLNHTIRKCLPNEVIYPYNIWNSTIVIVERHINLLYIMGCEWPSVIIFLASVGIVHVLPGELTLLLDRSIVRHLGLWSRHHRPAPDFERTIDCHPKSLFRGHRMAIAMHPQHRRWVGD